MRPAREHSGTRRSDRCSTIASRRAVLGWLGASGAAAIAGCASDAGRSTDVDIVAGPGGQLVFEPTKLNVTSGATVTWLFESAGHNVSANPQHSDLVELPAGAEPFASYGAGSPRRLVPAGETFSTELSRPGRYQYVCIPHQGAGMVGSITVR